MKPFEFKKCFFQVSSDGKISLPKQLYPHVVLAGRSNVGKSTFINHFFQNKTLAKTSSKPGKTGLLNFFNVDERLFFVDMPGYGYAKRSKIERDAFQEMVDGYVSDYLDQIVFLHFIDGRHPPLENDWEFIQWAAKAGKKSLFIITKIDKVKNKERAETIRHLSDLLASYGTVVIYDQEEPNVQRRVKEELNKVLLENATICG